MKYQIGWQKFESTVEDQLTSPILDIIISKVSDLGSFPEQDYEESYGEENAKSKDSHFMLPISQQLIEDISLLSNFECWIGHTNFDLTNKTQDILDETSGVEILKILSRYRFFVGIGKMFDFQDVRKSIEQNIIPKEIENE